MGRDVLSQECSASLQQGWELDAGVLSQCPVLYV